MTKGICLTFYMHENKKHDGMLLYEWLLEFAKKNKLPGGSVFQARAGFGSHGVIHEEHFFELGANLPVEVVFILSQEQSSHLLDLLKKDKVKLFYTISEVDYGILNP